MVGWGRGREGGGVVVVWKRRDEIVRGDVRKDQGDGGGGGGVVGIGLRGGMVGCGRG